MGRPYVVPEGSVVPPPRSYTPIRRAGVGKVWPPDDSWSIGDLVAELSFWRSYAALRQFAVPRDTPVPVQVPAQRDRHDARWDHLVESAFKARRGGFPPSARQAGGHL